MTELVTRLVPTVLAVGFGLGLCLAVGLVLSVADRLRRSR